MFGGGSVAVQLQLAHPDWGLRPGGLGPAWGSLARLGSTAMWLGSQGWPGLPRLGLTSNRDIEPPPHRLPLSPLSASDLITICGATYRSDKPRPNYGSQLLVESPSEPRHIPLVIVRYLSIHPGSWSRRHVIYHCRCGDLAQCTSRLSRQPRSHPRVHQAGKSKRRNASHRTRTGNPR